MRKSEIQVLTGIPMDYNGAAIYALVDETGKKYIGSTTNFASRMNFHANHMRSVLKEGRDGYVCAKMISAILAGQKFHVEILEKLPNEITPEELNNRERFYLDCAGGLDATYNVRPIKLKPTPSKL